MKITVLDHGYVELIECWGHGLGGKHLNKRKIYVTENVTEMEYWPDFEVGVVEAARQSTQGSFRGWEPAPCDCLLKGNDSGGNVPHDPQCASVQNPGDRKLLKRLHTHKHMTPFEFAGLVLEVQAPIFVFREWHRHRTQSYNEASARYSPLPDLYYHPTMQRARLGSTTNKQAQGVVPFNEDGARDFINGNAFMEDSLSNAYAIAEHAYQTALAVGIPKELARLVMPVGHYSRMRAAANLRNWLAFMTLRCDPDAQWEIRQYAQVVSDIIEDQFPQTWKLWADNKG